jgi:cobalamin biosynthesis Mg chelatase CobN
MFKKITKNLIILSFIAFSFAFSNVAFADSTIYAFSRSDKNKFDIAIAEDMGYVTNINKPVVTFYPTNQLSTGVASNQTQNETTVNNDTATKTTSTSNTTTSKVETSTSAVKAANVKTVESGNNGVYSNLEASAYNSTRSSGMAYFMPTTFFEWFLVVLLILAIIVLYRMIVRNSRKVKTA